MGLNLIDSNKENEYRTSLVVLVGQNEKNSYVVDEECSIFYKRLSIEEVFVRGMGINEAIFNWVGVINPSTNEFCNYDKTLVRNLPIPIRESISELILLNSPDDIKDEGESVIKYKQLAPNKIDQLVQKNTFRGDLNNNRLTKDIIFSSIIGWENVLDESGNQAEFSKSNLSKFPIKATEPLTEHIKNLEQHLTAAKKN